MATMAKVLLEVAVPRSFLTKDAYFSVHLKDSIGSIYACDLIHAFRVAAVVPTMDEWLRSSGGVWE